MENTNTSSPQTNITLQNYNEVLDQMPHISACLENKVFKTVTLIVTIVTFISTLFGNLLVIIAHFRFKEFHKHVIHKFILHVALADLVLLYVLVTYPLELVYPSLFRKPYVCLTRSIFASISLSASITNLSLISTDRFVAVIFPLTHLVESKKKWRVNVLILSVWVGSIVTGVIVIKENMFVEYQYTGRIDGCPVAWYSVETLTTISTCFIMLALVLNFVLYGIVIRRLMRRDKDFNFNSTKKQMSKTKLMMYIYIAFAICWLPFLVCQTGVLIYPSNVKLKCYREYFFIPGFLNSGLNWIFYGIGNKKYRDAFKKILCPCKTGESS